MSRFQRIVSHRLWLPAVAIVTTAFLAPRANDAADRMSRVGRVAGVWGWEQAAEPVPAGTGGTGFRWTKPTAVVREPIRGSRIQIALWLVRPDPLSQPVTVEIKVGRAASQRLTLSRNGWHLVGFDLVGLLGEARWRSQGTITLTITATPVFVPAIAGVSGDTRQIGVGLGEIIWSGPAPELP